MVFQIPSKLPAVGRRPEHASVRHLGWALGRRAERPAQRWSVHRFLEVRHGAHPGGKVVMHPPHGV